MDYHGVNYNLNERKSGGGSARPPQRVKTAMPAASVNNLRNNIINRTSTKFFDKTGFNPNAAYDSQAYAFCPEHQSQLSGVKVEEKSLRAEHFDQYQNIPIDEGDFMRGPSYSKSTKNTFATARAQS
jgi:hypothetical protein